MVQLCGTTMLMAVRWGKMSGWKTEEGEEQEGRLEH